MAKQNCNYLPRVACTIRCLFECKSDNITITVKFGNNKSSFSAVLRLPLLVLLNHVQFYLVSTWENEAGESCIALNTYQLNGSDGPW